VEFSVIGAFCVVLLLLTVGELVSTWTKAFVPSVFVTAVLFLIGYWTVLPPDLVAAASFDGAILPLSVYLLLTHLGTMMSLQELLAQWRSVLIAFAGGAGICAMTLTLGVLIFDWTTVIAATPPLTGGVVASILMSDAVREIGLEELAILCTAMYIMQGFLGYPLTAFLLKKEANRLIMKYREGDLDEPGTAAASKLERIKFRIFPPTPEKFQSTYVILVKLGLVAFLASQIGPVIHLNPYVTALLLGVIFRELGFLDEKALVKANCFGFLMTLLMGYIFAGLNQASLEMLQQIVVPLFGILLIGSLGMLIFSWAVGRLLGVTREMSISIAMTALYGFPADYILTVEAVNSTTSDKSENTYAIDRILPQMLVGGFTAVSIASVIIAGVFIDLLE